MFKRLFTAAFIIMILFSVLTACGSAVTENANGTSDAKNNDEPQKAAINGTLPSELTVYCNDSTQYFDENFAKPVKEKLNITLKQVNSPLEDIVSAGDIPDLVTGNTGSFAGIQQLDLLSDLSELIKKHNFDMGRLVPSAVTATKNFSEKNEILFLPFRTAGSGLFYNKDLFDKFAQPYPANGMTWDEVTEKAKKMTREADGINYYGLLISQGFLFNLNQLGQGYVDPKTNTATVNNDNWKLIFNTFKTINTIQGNLMPQKDFTNFFNIFVKDRTAAMVAGADIFFQNQTDLQGFNWDMVTLPVFPQTGTNVMMNPNYIGITPVSKNKDAAFEVIKLLLSDEIQMSNSKNGFLTVLKDTNIQKVLGSDLPSLAGKNVAEEFKLPIGKTRPLSSYDDIARKVLNASYTDVIYNGKDVNTALREAEENINLQIKDEIGQKK